MSGAVSVAVRMYRLNELGDCFLLTFTDGAQKSRMLIDCGSFRNSGASIARVREVVADIKEQLAKQPLNVVVGTHQHNDHVSGFAHCENEFRALPINEVWLSWLDDPIDPMAEGITKAHHGLKVALSDARAKLHASASQKRGMRSLEIVDDMLGFYGAKGGTPPVLPAKAVELLKGLGRKDPQYLRPGRVMDLPGLPVGSVRVYVLGPPRESEALYRKDPRTGESYDHALAVAGLAANKILSAAANRDKQSREDDQYPFNERYKARVASQYSAALNALMKRYRRRDNVWRNIDDDWMEEAGALALYLDSFTNNTSVVIAIELVESGKVLLFAADAQTGNWASWDEVKWAAPGVSTESLLTRTILYKVGHHGSHNATLVKALEKMNRPDLFALIPVHKEDPNITKPNGWKMPAPNLLKRLIEKTSHRVLQMDCIHAPGCDPKKSPAKEAWEKTGMKPKLTELFIEVQIAG